MPNVFITSILQRNSNAEQELLGGCDDFQGGGMSVTFLLQGHAGSEPVAVLASRRVSGAQESDAMVLKDLARHP
jgi:hypothetical protein